MDNKIGAVGVRQSTATTDAIMPAGRPRVPALWFNTTPELRFCGIGYAIRVPPAGFLSEFTVGLRLTNPLPEAARYFSTPGGAAAMARRLDIEGAEIVELDQRWRMT